MTEQKKHDDAQDRVRAVQDEIRRDANRDMPGDREPLPPGTLPGVPDRSHGDENRDPEQK